MQVIFGQLSTRLLGNWSNISEKPGWEGMQEILVRSMIKQSFLHPDFFS